MPSGKSVDFRRHLSKQCNNPMKKFSCLVYLNICRFSWKDKNLIVYNLLTFPSLPSSLNSLTTTSVSGFVYPIVSHWVWADGGMLNVLGYRDFAGSGVVHALGGVCSFVGAAFIGPRQGRFQDGRPVDKPGHSVPVSLCRLSLHFNFVVDNIASLVVPFLLLSWHWFR